jgi:hypothetical protein
MLIALVEVVQISPVVTLNPLRLIAGQQLPIDRFANLRRTNRGGR